MATLQSLPNELFHKILGELSTRKLLATATISHKFCDAIACILYLRTIGAANLSHHQLILECFHPSAKWSTPGFPCSYLGITRRRGSNVDLDFLTGAASGDESRSDAAGPPDEIKGKDSMSTGKEEKCGATPPFSSAITTLAKLNNLYTHFRPNTPDQTSDRRARRRHPAGDVPGAGNTSSSQDMYDIPQTPTQRVHLESYERFSQLQTIVNLVKVGPRKGLFLSCITIGAGVVRVFRDWLLCQAGHMDSQDGDRGSGGDGSLLWLDPAQNIGIRIKVERENLDCVLGKEDDEATYMLEYEELIVRSTRLLICTEESLVQEQDPTGKALIIGQWRIEQ